MMYWTNIRTGLPAEPALAVPQKDVILVLPYLGFCSDAITRWLKSRVKRFYGFVNFRVMFQNTHRIKHFFPYKDRFNRSQKSKIHTKPVAGIVLLSTVVKPKEDCLTERRQSTSKFSLKLSTPPLPATGHKIKWDHFEILASGQCDLHSTIKAALLTRDLKSALNENVGSEKLFLY